MALVFYGLEAGSREQCFGAVKRKDWCVELFHRLPLRNGRGYLGGVALWLVFNLRGGILCPSDRAGF